MNPATPAISAVPRRECGRLTRPRRGSCADRHKIGEDLVSLLSRNRSQDRVNGVRGHAMRMAQQAAPLANQAVPMAKNAGTTIRTGATGAVEWATPKVNDL